MCLIEWNDTERDYPADKCIARILRGAGRACVEAIAVVFQDQQLSYRELNTRANQLAHYLRKLGVGPERARRHLPGPLHGNDRRFAGHSQSRWGLCAA